MDVDRLADSLRDVRIPSSELETTASTTTAATTTATATIHNNGFDGLAVADRMSSVSTAGCSSMYMEESLTLSDVWGHGPLSNAEADAMVSESPRRYDMDNVTAAGATATAYATATAAAAVREEGQGTSPVRQERRQQQQQREQLLHTRRPFDDVRDAGPASDPLLFPRPLIERGRRDDVLYYNPTTNEFDVAGNVLFRDFGGDRIGVGFGDDGDGGDRDEGLHRVERAYWRVPYKETIGTIMGHVEICTVLRRCARAVDSDGSDEENGSRYGDDDDDDEEDIVFEITDEHVAVKVNYSDKMERMRHSHAEDPLKEVAAMQLIGNDHPNVLGCIEVLFDGDSLNVVLPYCGSGDLFQVLSDHKRLNPFDPGLPEAKARYWFRQILEGMKYLQSLGICHRDLSPENIMIDRNACLIIDMGMCLRIPYSSSDGSGSVTDATQGTTRRLIRPQGACGKRPYMAPEIYLNRDDFDGFAVDVWTAGTILFCMLTGNSSYERAHITDPQFYWMTRDLPALLGKWGVSLSSDAIDLLQNMLSVEPRERATLEEVEFHPWMSLTDHDVSQNMEDD